MDWEAPQSLVGYSPWGCKESDRTERLHSLSLFLWGSGNPLEKRLLFIYFFSHPSNRYLAGCRMMTERWVLWLLINVPIFTPKAYLCLGVWRYQCLKIPLTVCLFKPTSLGSGLFSLYYHFCRASFSVILSLWTQAAPNCLYGTGG